MSGGNGYGSYRSTRATDMAAHDACPAWLRHVLHYSVADWAAVLMRREMLRMVEFAGPEFARKAIIEIVKTSQPLDTYRFYGPDHPEAHAGGRKLRPAKNAAWSPKARQARRA